MSTFWCELAWLNGQVPDAGVVIEVEGERIASVAAGMAAPAGATVLRGLTLPAFANTHSHSFQRALRGRTQRELGGSFWSWREQMYELAGTIEVERFEALARATFAEMALAGIGVVGEFHYLHDGDNEFGWAVMRAAAAAGIRITLLDTCYLHGGLPRFRDASAQAWAERVTALDDRPRPPGARLGAAIHSVRAVDPPAAARVAGFAAEREWPLHAHVSEQPAENDECRERYGLTPIELLHDCGTLSPRFTAVHGTHFTPEDHERLDEAGGLLCLCPTTERDLADGVGPAHPRGALALGSDSHAIIDMLEEARAVELDERLRSGVRGHHTAAALAGAATANGYASLGWPDGGRIETGALADLVTVVLDSPRLAGTRPDEALDAVIFAGTRDDVAGLIVGGRLLERDPERVAAELHAAIP